MAKILPGQDLMKTAEKYILKEFLRFFTLTLAAFVLVFLLLDLFENMDNFVKYGVTVKGASVLFLYQIPYVIGETSPMAVLLSTLISLGLLSRHGEVTAIRAGGVRLTRALIPLFVTGAIISGVVIFINESLGAPGIKKAEHLRSVLFGAFQPGSFGSQGLWLRVESGIINIRDIDIEGGKVYGFTAYETEKPFRIKRHVSSREATWKGGGWVAQDVTLWDFSPDGRTQRRVERGFVIEGLAPPEELPGLKNVGKNMGMGELKDFIKTLEEGGYDAHRYRTNFYSRLTFPFVNLIMVFVGIPFALKTGRHGGIAAGMGLSVVIGFSFWVVFAVSKSLGSAAVVPPLLAAAFPDVLFLGVAYLMLRYVRE